MSIMNTLGRFKMTSGSTTANNGKYIFDDGKSTANKLDNIDYSNNDDDGLIICSIYQKLSNNEFDLDSIMVSYITSQRSALHRSVRKDDPKLSRNYGTSDKMLRYKHLK